MTQNSVSPSFSAPTLLIDGSGSSVFVGLLNADVKWIAYTEMDGAPLETLFPATEDCLKQAGLHFNAISSFLYNEGPGSVLGLRLCAMAIETWTRLYPASRELYAYNTLQFCARMIQVNHKIQSKALLVSDWKKGAWNAVYLDGDTVGETEVVDDAQLSGFTGNVFHLPQRKGWQKPPAAAETVSLELSRFPEIIHSPGLLTACDSVELYTSAVNTFQKWTPERHRAPV